MFKVRLMHIDRFRVLYSECNSPRLLASTRQEMFKKNEASFICYSREFLTLFILRIHGQEIYLSIFFTPVCCWSLLQWEREAAVGRGNIDL